MSFSGLFGFRIPPESIRKSMIEYHHCFKFEQISLTKIYPEKLLKIRTCDRVHFKEISSLQAILFYTMLSYTIPVNQCI